MNTDIFREKIGVIFDFDGVICDSVNIKTQAFLDLYKETDQIIQDKIKEFHLQNGGISRYEKIKYFEEKLLKRDLSKDQYLNLINQFSENVINNVINSKYINGAFDFLKQCKSQFKVFLCTATPQFEIEKILKSKGINKYFDAVYGSPDDKYFLFKKILDEQYIDNNQLIYFGDSISDFDVAKFYNIDFIGITEDSSVFPDGTLIYNDFQKLISYS